MFYNFAITVPAGRLEAEPVEQELNLTYGVIHRVIVIGRPGFNGYVKARLYYRRHQIIPTNIDEEIIPGRFPLIYPEHYFLYEPPHNLVVIAYSPGSVEPHTFEVSIGILAPEHFPEYQEERGKMSQFFKLIGIGG